MPEPFAVKFVVPGDPVSWPRPRFAKRGHAYNDPKYEEAKQKIALCFRKACGPRDVDIESMFMVVCRFFLGTRRRADTDRLLNSVLDSLQGMAYRDDWQVSMVVAERHYSDLKNPRSEILVERLDGDKSVGADTF